MSTTEKQRLTDMLVHGRIAHGLARGLGSRDFAGNESVRYAVQYLLLVIGEASMHVPEPVKAGIAGISWPKLQGLRHRLAHGYATIDPHMVYLTAVNDLRTMLPILAAHLAGRR